MLRRGHVLDILTKANRVVMDGAGQLTTGNISLVQTRTLAELDDAVSGHRPGPGGLSEHPIARAFRNQPVVDGVLPAASDVTPVIGHGIEGKIAGKPYRLGSARWIGLADDEDAAQGLAIYLADEHGPLAAARGYLASGCQGANPGLQGGRSANHHTHR